MAVEEDVDIYSAEDVLWAIATRVNPAKDIIKRGSGGLGAPIVPVEQLFPEEGGMAIDATLPFDAKRDRLHYPVDKIDLRKWFSEEQIATAKALQSPHTRMLAETGR